MLKLLYFGRSNNIGSTCLLKWLYRKQKVRTRHKVPTEHSNDWNQVQFKRFGTNNPISCGHSKGTNTNCQKTLIYIVQYLNSLLTQIVLQRDNNRNHSGNNNDDICVINDSDSRTSDDDPVSTALVLKEMKYEVLRIVNINFDVAIKIVEINQDYCENVFGDYCRFEIK